MSPRRVYAIALRLLAGPLSEGDRLLLSAAFDTILQYDDDPCLLDWSEYSDAVRDVRAVLSRVTGRGDGLVVRSEALTVLREIQGRVNSASIIRRTSRVGAQ